MDLLHWLFDTGRFSYLVGYITNIFMDGDINSVECVASLRMVHKLFACRPDAQSVLGHYGPLYPIVVITVCTELSVTSIASREPMIGIINTMVTDTTVEEIKLFLSMGGFQAVYSCAKYASYNPTEPLSDATVGATVVNIINSLLDGLIRQNRNEVPGTQLITDKEQMSLGAHIYRLFVADLDRYVKLNLVFLGQIYIKYLLWSGVKDNEVASMLLCDVTTNTELVPHTTLENAWIVKWFRCSRAARSPAYDVFCVNVATNIFNQDGVDPIHQNRY
jgi:hypothetical protein